MKGDFLGFSFDGVHSQDLGIVRVSNSDRYQEELFPDFEDAATELPGVDGKYYYGSRYTERKFEISFAFDSMTEMQFRHMRRLFAQKKNCRLIFDERPYKVYIAKVESPIELEYICFDEPKRAAAQTPSDGIRVVERTYSDTEPQELQSITREQIYPWVYETDTNGNQIMQRIYKGEGKIEFICYFPFARQLYKTLDLYENNQFFTTYTNVDEWKESSGLMTQSQKGEMSIDTLINDASGTYDYVIPVYNPGDLNVGFWLFIPFTSNGEINGSTKANNRILVGSDNDYLLINPIIRKNNADMGVIINTVNHLIEGVAYDSVTYLMDEQSPNLIKTGTVYNEYIYKGSFPYIKRDDWRLDDINHQSQGVYISCNQENSNMKIFYNYLYF